MNKKFMVVALMAALSTVGYAISLDEQVANNKTAITGLSNIVTEIDNKVNGLDEKFATKGELKDEVTKIEIENSIQNGRLDEAEKKLENKADYSDLAAVEADKNAIKEQVDKNKAEQDKVNAAQKDKDAEQDAAIALGDRVNNVQNQQIGALQTENVEQNNKIEALDKNKVDKNTYEEDKKAQADKDAAQDAEIAKGDRIDKVQNQQIGNLQSQNIAQDKNIQANKDAIAENKNQIAANKAEQDKVNAEQKENNKQQQEAIEANKGNIAANRVDIDKNRDDITALQQNFDRYEGRLSGLEKKVDHLDDKMNKGLSLMAAMNAVDFQNVQTGEMALGAGIGHYGNAQSVALGVAYAPVEDLTVNAKYSITAGDADSFALGAGATYKFKVGR